MHSEWECSQTINVLHKTIRERERKREREGQRERARERLQKGCAQIVQCALVMFMPKPQMLYIYIYTWNIDIPWKYRPVTGQTRCPLTSTFRGDCNGAIHDHIWLCFRVVISCRFWRPLSITTSYRFASRWSFLTNNMLFSIYISSWVQWDQARPCATPRSCPRP